MTWATSTGSTVVGSLVPTAAEYDSTIIESGVTYGLIKYTFSGSPNLSGVLAGHRLTVAGFTNAENNGTYRVYDANDTTDEIRVYNTSRLSNSLDETGITGTGSVADAGAVITEPSTAKKAQGFLTPEKPSDGMWNWLLNDIYNSIAQFAIRDDIAAWVAVDRTGADETYEFIKGWGIYRYDPDSTLIADGETVLEPTTGGGRGILEAAHPDSIFAYAQLMYGEPVYTISTTETLDFPSVSANGGVQELTVTLAGVKVQHRDEVTIGLPDTLNNGLIVQGYVSDDDEVTVRVTNTTGGSIDPASAIYRITARKF